MSLVSFIGPRPNIFDLEGNSKRKRLEVRQPILTNEDLEKIRCIGHFEDRFDTKTLDITYASERGADGDGGDARPAVRARRGRRARRLQHHHPVRPARRPRPHRDPRAARHGGGASPPDPQGPAHVGRPRRRDGRSARGASFRAASPATARRRSTRISPSRRSPRMAKRVPRGGRRRRGRQALHQVGRQGPAEGDVQDGHLDLPVLLRRADLRRGRSAPSRSSTATSSARIARSSGVGLAGGRRRDGAAPRRRVRRLAGLSHRARRRRRIRLPHPRRGACPGRRRRCRCCSTRCAATRRTSIATTRSS